MGVISKVVSEDELLVYNIDKNELDEGEGQGQDEDLIKRSVESDVDYEALYANVNQIARAVGTGKVRCGEVLAVQQMFVRLDSLDVAQLLQAERVRRLIVFADVVEIQGGSVALPGSALILIACRVLHLKNRDVQLDLPYWNVVNNSSVTSSAVPRCSIHAQQVVVSRTAPPPLLSSIGSLIIRVKRDLQWSDKSPFTQYIVRYFSYSGANTVVTAPVSPNRPPSFHWLQIVSTQRRVTVMINEIKWMADIDFQVALPLLDDLTDIHVIKGIESTLQIVELILTYRSDRMDAVAAALEHLQWINKSLVEVVQLPNSERVLELKALAARAQMLLKLPIDGSHSLKVPQLQYGQYNDVIDQMAVVAEAYNSEFRALDLFIQGNQIIGDYMLTQMKLMSTKEKDVADLESLMMLRKEQELKDAMERLQFSEEQLLKQVEEMTEAQRQMEQGVKEYENRLTANAFFAVLGASMTIVGSLMSGSIGGVIGGIGGTISEARDIISMMDDAVASRSLLNVANGLIEVERVFEVVNAIYELYKTASSLEDLLVAEEMPIIPASEWDIMENNMEAVAATMPTEVSEALVWKAKCKNVMAVCREICTSAVTLTELQYDLFVHARKQEIAQRHADRLAEFKAADLSEYMEMASQVDTQNMRVLISLLSMLAVQNGALQYNYLMPPEPFTGWSTVESVRSALVRRKHQAVIRKASMGASHELPGHTYVLQSVPVGLLLSGEDYIFTIDPSGFDFESTWSRVRILHLEIKFTGEHQPHGGPREQAYFLLQPSSHFQDRWRNQVFHYEAVAPLIYQYAYNLNTGQTTLPNIPHEEATFLRMTPFTRWRLRLSASASQNQGISFPTATAPDSTTQITITFYVSAHVQPQSKLLDHEAEDPDIPWGEEQQQCSTEPEHEEPARGEEQEQPDIIPQEPV